MGLSTLVNKHIDRGLATSAQVVSTERQLETTQRAHWRLTPSALTALTAVGTGLGAVVVSVIVPPALQLVVPVLVFGSLAILSENLDLLDTRSGVAMSGSMMVFGAAMVVFRAQDQPLGPVLVGLCGGLCLRHMRAGEWTKVVFNGAAFAAAMSIASVPYWLLPDAQHSSPVVLLGASALCASLYVLVNAALVSLVVACASGEPYRAVLRVVRRSDGGVYAFALCGLGIGWLYLHFGAEIVPLVVVPVLIARGAFASYLELRAAQEQTIETLIHTLEAKDPYTAGHAQRVANFAEYVGAEFTFGPKRLERLRYAALMHDIGKLIVPNQLLNKPGRLTEAEFARVRRHEGISVELLGRIDFLAPVAPNTTTEASPPSSTSPTRSTP